MTASHLAEERQKILDVFEKADQALSRGEISKQEHRALLTDLFGSHDKTAALAPLERQIRGFTDGDGKPYSFDAVALMSGFFVIVVSLFAVMFYSAGGITGAAVYDAAHDLPNHRPLLLRHAPDVVTTGPVSIDLTTFFADPDGESLTFKTSEYPENVAEVQNHVLRLRGEPGTYVYVVYASDGHSLTSTNAFLVTFLE